MRLMSGCLALVAGLAASSANAADDPKDCAVKATDAERLSCYDAIYRVTPSAPVTAGAWIIQREVSKIDDTENVMALVESREPHIAKFGRAEKLSLILMCREHELMAYIIFADVFMSNLNEGGKVTYRVDKQSANPQFSSKQRS